MIKNYETLKGVIWYNGRFIKAKNTKLHVLSHGLHFASVTFEGIRVYNKKAFRLNAHIKRLFKSAKILDIKISKTPNVFKLKNVQHFVPIY